mgnify:CR=1 FL=1
MGRVFCKRHARAHVQALLGVGNIHRVGIVYGSGRHARRLLDDDKHHLQHHKAAAGQQAREEAGLEAAVLEVVRRVGLRARAARQERRALGKECVEVPNAAARTVVIISQLAPIGL